MAVEREEVPEDLTVRGAIKAAIDEVGGLASEPEGPTTDPEAALPSPIAQDDKVRDEQGRFVKAEQAPKRETLTLPKKPEVQPKEPSSGAAPTSWPDSLKSQFGTLTPELRSYLTKRDQEVSQALSRDGDERRFAREVRETVQPYMATINAEGTTPVRAIASLLNMAHIMRFGNPQQKQQLLIDTARLYNVPLNALPSPVQVDPQVASLQQRLNQLEMASRQAELTRQQQEAFSYTSQVDSFANENGHEHFDQVRQVMAALIENGSADSLQDAYDQAIWARPDLRSTLLEQQNAQRISQAKQAADKARRASGSITGAPGALAQIGGPDGQDRSLRDELRANMRAAQGRI